jgi:hypothetical protein
VNQIFPPGSGLNELMLGMLAFDPEKRPTARVAAERWRGLLQSWVQPGKADKASSKAEVGQQVAHEIVAYMNAVLRRDVGMSAKQWDLIMRSIDNLGGKIDELQTREIEELRKRIKELRESGDLR